MGSWTRVPALDAFLLVHACCRERIALLYGIYLATSPLIHLSTGWSEYDSTEGRAGLVASASQGRHENRIILEKMNFWFSFARVL